MRPVNGRAGTSLPTLALVDVFVGGVAVLLVFILLASRTEPRRGQMPQADVTVRCESDLVVLPGAAPRPITEAMDGLFRLAPEDRLTLRVRIEATSAEAICAAELRYALDAANDELDADPSLARPHVLSAVVLVELHDGASDGTAAP